MVDAILLGVPTATLASGNAAGSVGLSVQPRKDGAIWGCWTGFLEFWQGVGTFLLGAPGSSFTSGKGELFFRSCRPGYGSQGRGCSLGSLDPAKSLVKLKSSSEVVGAQGKGCSLVLWLRFKGV